MDARKDNHGRGAESVRRPRMRGVSRIRGRRIRAQAHGPPRPPLGPEALQRAAPGDRYVPELAREDAEGARRGRHRGTEVPSGPPVAVEYRLSPKGLDLFEAIRDLERWAARWVTN